MKRSKRIPEFAVLIILLVVLVIFATYLTLSRLAADAVRKEEARGILTYHEKISRYLNERIDNIGTSSLLYLSRAISVGGLRDLESDERTRRLLQRNMQLLTLANPDIDSIYIYSGVDQKIFYFTETSCGLDSFASFYDTGSRERFLSMNAYSYLTGTRRISPSYLRGSTSAVGETKSVVSLFKKLPFRGDSKDVVTINFSLSLFDDLLGSSNIPKSSIFVLANGEGEAVVRGGLEEGGQLGDGDIQTILREMNGNGGAVKERYLELHKKRYFVCGQDLGHDRLYFMLVPVESMGVEYADVNMTMLLLGLSILGIGICLAIFLSGTISHPLNDLSARLKGDAPPASNRSVVLYPLLKEMRTDLDQMLYKAKEQEQMLSRYFSFYRDSMLCDFLSGQRELADLPEGLSALFQEEALFQLIYCIFPDGEDTELEALEARLGGYGHVERIRLGGDGVVFLLCGQGENLDLRDVLLKPLREMLQDKPARFLCAVGSPCASAMEIPASFLASRELLKNWREGDEPVVSSSAEAETQQVQMLTINRFMEQIISLATGADTGAVHSKTAAFFKAMKRCGFSIRRIRKQCLYLLYQLILLSPSASESFADENVFQTIQGLDDADSVEEWLCGQLRAFHSESLGRAFDTPSVPDPINAKLIKQVELYVEEHFREEISLNQIADYVYFSPQYLSKLFRDLTGITFTTYLIQVRMREASQMLIKTKKSVAVIAKEVGYSSAQSFGRIFKSHFGLSPGDYRKGNGVSNLEK